MEDKRDKYQPDDEFDSHLVLILLYVFKAIEGKGITEQPEYKWYTKEENSPRHAVQKGNNGWNGKVNRKKIEVNGSWTVHALFLSQKIVTNERDYIIEMEVNQTVRRDWREILNYDLIANQSW
jgi:hypothetical protein